MLGNIISVLILVQDQSDGLSLTLMVRSAISKVSQHGVVDCSLPRFQHQKREFIVGNDVATLVVSGAYLFTRVVCA